MLQGDDSLWESFPRAIESQAGTQRYVSAYRSHFQESRLNPHQEHTLRACSLLAILPPPPGQEALPDSVLDDLSQVNLSAWAEMVQDVAAGMLALLSGLSDTLFPDVLDLLTHLESASQVPFYHCCYLPGTSCQCLGVHLTATAPLSTMGPLWSEIVDPTPIYEATTGTPRQGASGVAPPPGLTASGLGSIWDIPTPDFPALPRVPGITPPPLQALGIAPPP